MPLTPPPVDHNAIRIGMVRAVMEATGLDQQHVIMAEPETPNSPRPSRPYMTLKAVSVGIRYGDDVSEQVEGSDKQAYRGPRMMLWSFNAYGESHEQAYDLMSVWQAALEMWPTRERLAEAGISVWLPGAISDLSALMETAYEGRAQMDCRIGVASYATTDLGQIETVPVGPSVIAADVETGTVSADALTVTAGV